jgi:hypothetical protein
MTLNLATHVQTLVHTRIKREALQVSRHALFCVAPSSSFAGLISRRADGECAGEYKGP